MRTGSKVFNQISWFFLAVNLNIINSGICVVGQDKVDNTISAEEGNRRCRTVIIQTTDIYITVFKVDNT